MNKLALILLLAVLSSSPISFGGSNIVDANGAMKLSPVPATALLSGMGCLAYKVSNKPVPLPHQKCRFS